MTDKDKSSTLSDNEIIKAFECCYLYDDMFCDKCPNKDTCGEIDVAESTLDLINRLKAENERLENERFCLANERDAMADCLNEAVEEAKSEARKEFAERVLRKATFMRDEETINGVVKVNDVYETLEEMGCDNA